MRRDPPPGVVRLARERQSSSALHAQHAARVGVPIRDAERGRRAAQAASAKNFTVSIRSRSEMVTAGGQRHRADAVDHDAAPSR